MDDEVKKGFLIDSSLDNEGALKDPRSSQKMSNVWNSESDISKGALGSSSEGNGGWGSSSEENGGWDSSWKGNGGWDKYLENNKVSGWGIKSGSKHDPMVQDSKIEDMELDSDYDMSSLLDNRPLLPRNLGAPKNVISVWYGKRHRDIPIVVNKCFTTWDDGGSSHEKYFTSVFTCPVTGEMFSCGRYDDKSSYLSKKEKIPKRDNLDIDKSTEEIAVIWYRKKVSAEHSAAARALDCLSFRENNPNGLLSMSYGLCDDDPYMIAAEAPPLSTSAPKSLLNHLADEMHTCGTRGKPEDVCEHDNNILIVEEELRSEFESVYDSVIKKKENAKAALIKWYDKNHKGNPYSPSWFKIWSDNGPTHNRRFTGIFQCPVTGEIFSCGQYCNLGNYEVKEEESCVEAIGGNATARNISVVWYRKKSAVEIAAAARVLDCTKSREISSSHTSSIRLCIEDPYLSPDDAPPLSSLAPAELYA